MWGVEEIDIDLICDLVQLARSVFGSLFLVQTASEVLQSVLTEHKCCFEVSELESIKT